MRQYIALLIIVQEWVFLFFFRMDSQHASTTYLVRDVKHAQVANEMDWNAISH
jgi:hypothetical protein